MAFFTFRKSGSAAATPPSALESIEVMRRRARHRLIGSAVLVLLGVIGFPLLFDSQPRPIPVDIPIRIPDRTQAAPLESVPPAAANHASGAVIEERESSPTTVPVQPLPEPVAAKREPTPEVAAPAKVPPKPSAPVTTAPAPSKPAHPAHDPASEAGKVQALLDGKAVDHKDDKKADKKPVADAGRFVVQVGAYNEPAKLADARSKVEKAGFKTYTQVVGSKESQRTRVRVGPFDSRAEAQKAADKIKKLSLPAAILEL